MNLLQALAGFAFFLLLVVLAAAWIIRDWERTRRRRGVSAVEQTQMLREFRDERRWGR